MLANIWVRDNVTGHIHQVGTDPHDSLELIDGRIEYVNMQCLESTAGNLYDFVEAPDLDGYIVITPDELRLNRELIHKDFVKLMDKRRSKKCPKL